MYFSLLPQRGLIKVSGEDKLDFLQGIVSNDMRLVGEDSLVYACFLTPQGKYLADFFVFQYGDDWLIDVDAALTTDLIRRMTMYKLRSKVTLTDVSDDFNVYAFWGDIDTTLPALNDPRCEAIGKRGYFPADQAINFDNNDIQGDYPLLRLQNGLPEFKDFERERSSMAEVNMDLLNAISWDKGCYMGQELTARMHYRGLAKKRLLPIRAAEDITSVFDTPIKEGTKTIGHLRTSYKNYALALISLDTLEKSKTATIDGQEVTILLPDWFVKNEETVA